MDMSRTMSISMAQEWACHEQRPFLHTEPVHVTNNALFYGPEMGMSRNMASVDGILIIFWPTLITSNQASPNLIGK